MAKIYISQNCGACGNLMRAPFEAIRNAAGRLVCSPACAEKPAHAGEPPAVQPQAAAPQGPTIEQHQELADRVTAVEETLTEPVPTLKQHQELAEKVAALAQPMPAPTIEQHQALVDQVSELAEKVKALAPPASIATSGEAQAGTEASAETK